MSIRLRPDIFLELHRILTFDQKHFHLGLPSKSAIKTTITLALNNKLTHLMLSIY